MLKRLFGNQGVADGRWDDPFATLRKKWSEVPVVDGRVRSTELFAMDDRELLETWERMRTGSVTGHHFEVRGWYHLLYKPLIKNARLIDFGSGLGFDGLSFAAEAARVTFVDVARENLDLLKRLAALKGLRNVEFVWLESFESLNNLEREYDLIMAIGSLHHAPFEVVHRESRDLASRLKIGGRWLQLAYPKSRWEREGRPHFSKWGEMTDGAGTPWAEWYDIRKVLDSLAPARFDAVMAFEYCDHAYNWFDLVRQA